MTVYRNEKLLKLAKEVPCCMRCRSLNRGQIVAAHANMQSMGKGTGFKAADIPAFLCDVCHDFVDGRSGWQVERDERNAEWAIAAAHSMRWALEHHPEVFSVKA